MWKRSRPSHGLHAANRPGRRVLRTPRAAAVELASRAGRVERWDPLAARRYVTLEAAATASGLELSLGELSPGLRAPARAGRRVRLPPCLRRSPKPTHGAVCAECSMLHTPRSRGARASCATGTSQGQEPLARARGRVSSRLGCTTRPVRCTACLHSSFTGHSRSGFRLGGVTLIFRSWNGSAAVLHRCDALARRPRG